MTKSIFWEVREFLGIGIPGPPCLETYFETYVTVHLGTVQLSETGMVWYGTVPVPYINL